MGNLVIYTTHHNIHKVVKCKEVTRDTCSFSAETRNTHGIVVVTPVARLQQRWRNNMKLHLGGVSWGVVECFEVAQYYSQHYFLLLMVSTINFKIF